MNSSPRRSKHRQSEEPVERERPRPRPRRESFTPRWLRIVAGELRGQRVQYSGDPSIRPMKDRTRESVFNLLGGDLSGTLAIDLFAGTGVLGLEAISRGAERAILLELQRPAVSTIVANAARLKIADKVEVHNVDTLRWLKYIESTAVGWPNLPWVVFCCPPYQMWETELERLSEGLLKLYAICPVGSMFVVETENDFDIRANFPQFEWDVRLYKPATVGIAEKKPAEETQAEAKPAQ